MSERLFTTYALRDFMSAVGKNEASPDAIGGVPENALTFPKLKAKLQAGCTVVFTLGLSFCWFKRDTDELVHSIIPADKRDIEARGGPGVLDERFRNHEMRPTTVEENKNNIHSVIDSIRSFNPDNKIVLTVSPIPLQYIKSDIFSILTGDFMSKAVLRMAVSEIERLALPNVYYFPSFEIVRGALPHCPGTYWGTDGNARHLDDDFIRMIIEFFILTYFKEPDPIIQSSHIRA